MVEHCGCTVEVGVEEEEQGVGHMYSHIVAGNANIGVAEELQLLVVNVVEVENSMVVEPQRNK